VTLIHLIVQETLQRLEQKGSESAFISISGLDKTAFNDPAKEFLSQILRVGNRMTLPANERENWPPINFAKLRKRILCFVFIAGRVRARQNDAPSRRQEASMGVVKGGVPFHRRE